MSATCHECSGTIASDLLKEYAPAYGVSIMRRERGQDLLISDMHQIICHGDYSKIVEGVRTLDEIEDYESHMDGRYRDHLFVITNETQNVLQIRGVIVDLVVPTVGRFGLARDDLSSQWEEFRLPTYGVISPELAERSLPNCYRDLSRLLESNSEEDWIDFAELQPA